MNYFSNTVLQWKHFFTQCNNHQHSNFFIHISAMLLVAQIIILKSHLKYISFKKKALFLGKFCMIIRSRTLWMLMLTLQWTFFYKYKVSVNNRYDINVNVLCSDAGHFSILLHSYLLSGEGLFHWFLVRKLYLIFIECVSKPLLFKNNTCLR